MLQWLDYKIPQKKWPNAMAKFTFNKKYPFQEEIHLIVELGVFQSGDFQPIQF